MRILQLAPRMPYPLTDGGAVGIYNITKYLARAGHSVTLVTFPLDSVEETSRAVENISQFATVCLTKQPLPSRKSVLLRTLFRGAYPIARRESAEMFALLERLLSAETFDVIHVDHSHMAAYVPWMRQRWAIPIVLRQHNFETLIYERYARLESNLLKSFVARVHGKRLRKAEIKLLGEVDAVAAITEEDERAMAAVAPSANYRVIPAGVDTEYYQPAVAETTPNSVLWVGGMAWDPNLDAIRYFLADIFPAILRKNPEVKFDIVGSDQDRLEAAVEPFSNSVRLLGRVPDIRDYLLRSSVLVVPLRIGGGMRVKLLEFFAAGKAVVSTSIGAEGNRARDGEELLLRDGPAAFASAVLQLLADSEERSRLGRNARQLAVDVYSWGRVASEFEELYRDVVAAGRVSQLP